MNNKQKKIFLVMVSINTLMGLFPPWQQLFRINSRAIRNVGYDFILTPPTETATISLSTLLVQVAIVSFVCVALIYYFKTPKISVDALDTQIRVIMSALLDGDVEKAVKAMKIVFNEEEEPKPS